MDNELKMRNNKIRKLFAEIVSILCYRKKNSSDILKLINRI